MSKIKVNKWKVLVDDEGQHALIVAPDPLEAAYMLVKDLVLDQMYKHGEEYEIPESITVRVEGVDKPIVVETSFAMMTFWDIRRLHRNSEMYGQLVELAEKAREEFGIEIGQYNPLVVFEEMIDSYRQDLEILKKNADGWKEEEHKVRKLEAVIEHLEAKLENRS